MGKIEDNICKAIDTIVKRRLSKTKFSKTIIGEIIEIIKNENTVPQYRIKYQDSKITVKSLATQEYKLGQQVYILLTEGDLTTGNQVILGLVR